jgi:hypothetical protein
VHHVQEPGSLIGSLNLRQLKELSDDMAALRVRRTSQGHRQGLGSNVLLNRPSYDVFQPDSQACPKTAKPITIVPPSVFTGAGQAPPAAR